MVKWAHKALRRTCSFAGRAMPVPQAKGADDRRDHFYRLDMNKLHIRNKARGVTSNAELDRIFEHF
jgi:type III restriction enzyme